MLKSLALLDRYFEEVICGVLLCALMLLLGTQVVLRFGFGTALTWSEELIRFLFVWFAYLGAVLGAQRGGHIRITTFVSLLPRKNMREVVLLIADLSWICFNLSVVYISYDLLEKFSRFPQSSAAMGVDLFWVYLIVPISFFLMTVRLIQWRVWAWRRGEAAVPLDRDEA